MKCQQLWDRLIKRKESIFQFYDITSLIFCAKRGRIAQRKLCIRVHTADTVIVLISECLISGGKAAEHEGEARFDKIDADQNAESDRHAQGLEERADADKNCEDAEDQLQNP